MLTLAPYTRQSAVIRKPDPTKRAQVAPKPPTQAAILNAVKLRGIDRKIRLAALPRFVGLELQCPRCKGSFLGISYRRCACSVLSPSELQGRRV